MELEFEGKCYIVLHIPTKSHPILEHWHDFVWYPERAMNLLDQIQYLPYVKSIVTESAWLISCYDQEDVRIWKDGKWRIPNYQTYGASVSFITMKMGISQTMASAPLDGGNQIRKLIRELEKEYV